MIKAYWEKISQRDQRVLIIGVFAIFLLLGYVYLWSPLNQALAEQYAQTLQKQDDVIWMQKMLQKATLEHLNIRSIHSSSRDLAQSVQQQMSAHHLTAYQTHVTPSGKGKHSSVIWHFKKVPFDRLITSIQTLWQSDQIAVDTATIISSSSSGLVSALILFKKV